MKKAIRIGVLLGALCASAQQPQSVNPPRIPDSESALKIAERFLKDTYGKKKIDAEKPLSVKLIEGVWYVSGTLWCSDGKGGRVSGSGECVGGVAQIRLRQRDGKVLSIGHGK
jgi:hypothetical protein